MNLVYVVCFRDIGETLPMGVFTSRDTALWHCRKLLDAERPGVPFTNQGNYFFYSDNGIGGVADAFVAEFDIDDPQRVNDALLSAARRRA
jgi:hypothetical protein